MSSNTEGVPPLNRKNIPEWIYDQYWLYEPHLSNETGNYHIVLKEEVLYLPFFIVVNNKSYKLIAEEFNLEW